MERAHSKRKSAPKFFVPLELDEPEVLPPEPMEVSRTNFNTDSDQESFCACHHVCAVSPEASSPQRSESEPAIETFVPPHLRAQVLAWAHAPNTHHHRGYMQVSKLLADAYWWPHRARDIKKCIQACTLCAQPNRPRQTVATSADTRRRASVIPAPSISQVSLLKPGDLDSTDAFQVSRVTVTPTWTPSSPSDEFQPCATVGHGSVARKAQGGGGLRRGGNVRNLCPAIPMQRSRSSHLSPEAKSFQPASEHAPGRSSHWSSGVRCSGPAPDSIGLAQGSGDFRQIRLVPAAMRIACLLILCIQGIWAQQFEANGQYDGPTEVPYYYDYDDQSVAQQQPNPHVQTGFHILTQPDLHHFEFVPQQQQQNQQEIIPAPTFDSYQTEPTEPGPLDCREEQYPCTRLYSVHKPCKQCLNGICLYSLRRMYVINKEICVRTVCAHEELLRADLCRDKFPRCGVVASSGLCHSVGAQCTKSCGGC
ncbi:microfibrillar-associated protein 2 isoform X2 [Dendrobates tinctorius]|uniref:microfibrillar-associated protein 2 isoform X2 n=1 Tax=Dendrobates tinctorius TaxID=92724 RepID=UPI003CC9BA39